MHFCSAAVCPGVCVADRISCFCEAILDIPSLCKENLRCCVAKKIFGSENTPEELIFPKEDSRCKSGSNKEKKDEEEEEDEIMDTAESNTKLKLAKERERKEKEKREKERKEKERKEMEAKRRKEELEKKKQKKKEEEKEKAGLSPEGRCRGTCVTGFFSLLCDEIDRSAICPGQVISISHTKICSFHLEILSQCHTRCTIDEKQVIIFTQLKRRLPPLSNNTIPRVAAASRGHLHALLVQRGQTRDQTDLHRPRNL